MTVKEEMPYKLNLNIAEYDQGRAETMPSYEADAKMVDDF